jgi:hypothetical protein
MNLRERERRSEYAVVKCKDSEIRRAGYPGSSYFKKS